MFLGHFALAFAAKKVVPHASLGTTVLAAQFADVLWPVLLLAGWEQMRIVPGITAVTPLDFVSYPISHSLIALIIWGTAFGALYLALRRDRATAVWLGLLVVSHWLLDAASHRPDMPLYPDGPLVGLGLWYSHPATLAVEFAMFAIGLAIYLRTTHARDRTGSIALWCFAGLLAILYLGSVFGPPPPSVNVLAASALGGWLFALWAYWIDRHRVTSDRG